MKNDKNKLLCILSLLLLILILGGVLFLAYEVIRYYIHWCQSSQSAALGGWILSATWLLLPALILCFTLFVKAIRVWRDKVVHNGKWCILHEWKGCTCQYCGAHRDEEHHWQQCVCTGCGKTRHTPDKNGKCTRCGQELRKEKPAAEKE